MNSKIENLKKYLLPVCEIPNEEWSKIEKDFKLTNFKKGDLILVQGEPTNQLYFILKGLVRFFYITSTGKEFNKEFCAENEFIGSLLNLKNQEPSYFSIQALEECELLSINYNDLSGFYNSHICWEKIGRIMAEGLAVKAERRERDFLINSAKVRYHNFLKTYSHIKNRVNLGQIASYLGITQVQLSRIRSSKK